MPILIVRIYFYNKCLYTTELLCNKLLEIWVLQQFQSTIGRGNINVGTYKVILLMVVTFYSKQKYILGILNVAKILIIYQYIFDIASTHGKCELNLSLSTYDFNFTQS